MCGWLARTAFQPSRPTWWRCVSGAHACTESRSHARPGFCRARRSIARCSKRQFRRRTRAVRDRRPVVTWEASLRDRQHPKEPCLASDEPTDRTKAAIYFSCGACVGMLLAARMILSPFVSGGLAVAIIGAGGFALGYASARWGDSVWIWLGRWLRWLV